MPLRLSASPVPPIIKGRMLAPRASAPVAGGGGMGTDLTKQITNALLRNRATGTSPDIGIPDDYTGDELAAPSYLGGGDIGIPDDYAGLDVADQPGADIGIPDDYAGVDLSDAIAQTRISNALLG